MLLRRTTRAGKSGIRLCCERCAVSPQRNATRVICRNVVLPCCYVAALLRWCVIAPNMRQTSLLMILLFRLMMPCCWWYYYDTIPLPLSFSDTISLHYFSLVIVFTPRHFLSATSILASLSLRQTILILSDNNNSHYCIIIDRITDSFFGITRLSSPIRLPLHTLARGYAISSAFFSSYRIGHFTLPLLLSSIILIESLLLLLLLSRFFFFHAFFSSFSFSFFILILLSLHYWYTHYWYLPLLINSFSLFSLRFHWYFHFYWYLSLSIFLRYFLR